MGTQEGVSRHRTWADWVLDLMGQTGGQTDAQDSFPALGVNHRMSRGMVGSEPRPEEPMFQGNSLGQFQGKTLTAPAARTVRAQLGWGPKGPLTIAGCGVIQTGREEGGENSHPDLQAVRVEPGGYHLVLTKN